MPDFTTQYTNLADERLGAEVVFATDDFFAPKERMIHRADPIFIEGKYDDHGKWMDGWESRRKRTPGHDHVVVKLGRAGHIRGIEIDTRHFTGNYPPAASVEACNCIKKIPGEDIVWTEILPKLELTGDNRHFFEVSNEQSWTHIRLHIYPDGGVARLRIYGEITVDWSSVRGREIDLLAMEWGGQALSCNDAHFGEPKNIISPTVPINMGDGWETRRRRSPGHDWAIFALATPGVISRAVVETTFFKGNYPDRFSLQGANITNPDPVALIGESADWQTLLPEQKLSADSSHKYMTELHDLAVISHIRLNIFPDGGIARLRLFGKANT